MGPLTLHCSTRLSRSKPRAIYNGRDSLITGLHICSPLYSIYGTLPTGISIVKGVKDQATLDKVCEVIVQGALDATEATLALRATAAAERLRRALADLSMRFTRALQPTAEALGQGLHLSDEAIQLFSEEVKLPISFHSSASQSDAFRELHVYRARSLPGFLQQALCTYSVCCIYLVLCSCMAFPGHLSSRNSKA